jgi:hypothetical protein
MPIFDFNQNLYQFRSKGYCANPNFNIKGFVVSNKVGTESNNQN